MDRRSPFPRTRWTLVHSVLAMATVWLLAGGRVAGAEILVPGDQPTVQAAIDVSTDGDVVRVAPGIYPEVVDFMERAIVVVGTAGATQTTIEGRVRFGNVDSDSVLRGFTIHGIPGATAQGILVEGGGPTVEECVITGHDPGSQALRGGGLRATIGAGKTLTIRDCLFEGNTDGFGAGFFVQGAGHVLIEDAVCRMNHCTIIGAGALVETDTAVLRRCRFENNYSEFSAAGLSIGKTVNPLASGPRTQGLVEECDFIGNNASYCGPAFLDHVAEVLWRRCRFEGNSAGGTGGVGCGERNVSVFEQCVFVGNSAPGNAPSLYADAINGATLVFDRCTVADNTPAQLISLQPNTNVTFVSSILHAADDVHLGTTPGAIGTLEIRYSNVRGGAVGPGNIDADPAFVDSASGNYHLAFASPCVDAGDPASPLDPDGTTADQGAFPVDQTSSVFVRGDASRDGLVDLADPIRILNVLFQNDVGLGCHAAADANSDGRLDVGDALFLFAYVLLDGPPPGAPFPDCGADPSGSGLDCLSPGGGC